MKTKALSVLKQVYGFDDFRPMQEDIVLSVAGGQDTLALLPTGGGKSICFQVPALMKEGICIVVSPLIALMKDQVDNLRKKGVLAVAVYSGMRKREIDTVLDNCIYGNYRFLYVSPERLKTELFRERVKQMKVNMIAVDEAHCISQWGYDFRPPYLEIAELREIHPKVPVIALTASATDVVQQDILEKLKMVKPKVFKKSFARANLSYSVRMVENKEEKAFEILQKIPGSAIVYLRNRKATKQVSQALSYMGISATFYHAGLDNATREARQQDWITGKVRVIVATNAFGMGIDKPDVRTVIHLDLPENLENYYQEAGRAGRDEKKAYAVLLANEKDLQILAERAEKSYPPIEFLKRVYQCLANYYRIAVGSNMMSSFDFDISKFTDTYNLEVLSTYNALKVLQEENLIELTESFFVPSTLHFLVNHGKLYEFQVSYGKLDPLIKVLLRTYGGELFVEYLRIHENKLAQALKIPEQEVVRQLEQMDNLGILAYNKRKDQPQVTFLTARMDAGKLPLNQKRIAERRENARQKAQAITAYTKQDRICRTVQLQNYFGEDTEKECGVCDVCVQNKKRSTVMDRSLGLRQAVLATLSGGQALSMDELTEKVAVKNDLETVALLRELEDEGLIARGADGRIKMN
ncbi:RecQ family ATP-dependent DNA helicase [Litoribacter ruber]|uniref:ATP-dependent DNA helicase RecQ n=1 Tax=Litoribacter ruber TaxID=702568 RepID=A0AAP2G1C5_9BACT|nr:MULTISPECIES: RecQ family ATP-dependent DNA helicase [Litoribacter]MBS9523927.1 RecQ family ATP-dependent DNA helicase [Litoribacter alkaliphilus]MBT0811478.1 RecQ family ATP-dependent DNA helicase [Litoribacter ruber]